jgi:predicted nucleotidyltransferase
MNSLESLRARRDDILRIAIRHGAHNVRVFGSVARGEATEDSDVDLLVSTTDSTSPWFPAGLVVDLEDLLGCRVQVATEEGLYWLLRERIPSEARPL